jgi:hypothetical protein
MACVGKDRVRDGDEGVVEGCCLHDVELPAWFWVEAGADHADDAGYCDATHASDAEPAEPIERSRQRTDQSRNGEDSGVQHGAELVVA